MNRTILTFGFALFALNAMGQCAIKYDREFKRAIESLEFRRCDNCLEQDCSNCTIVFKGDLQKSMMLRADNVDRVNIYGITKDGSSRLLKEGVYIRELKELDFRDR